MEIELKQIKVYHTLFTLSEKKLHTNLQKQQLQKACSSVCM